MQRMRFFRVALMPVVLAAAAQRNTQVPAPSGAGQPLFQANTRLVEVDVTVHRKGAPVADLTQDDFTVFDQGKQQQIAAFSVRTPGNAAAPEPLPSGTISNRLNARGREPRGVTAVLFDQLNTAVRDQGFARLELLRYLRQISAHDQIALYSLNKTLRVVQDFTGDTDTLIRAATRAAPGQSTDEAAPLLVQDLPVTGDAVTDAMIRDTAAEMTDQAIQNRAEITAGALEIIARHLAGIPGRKTLVWLTAGFPASHTYLTHRVKSTQIQTKEYSREIDRAVRALNDANVAVYPIDPRDPYNGGFLAPGIDSMNLFAGGTGGKAAYVITDLAGAIRKAVADSEVTYTLGFYPSSDRLDGRYHSLRVKVAHSGSVTLHYRKGYFAAESKPPGRKQRQASLEEEFSDPLEATQIGLTARVQLDPLEAGIYHIELGFDVRELHLEQERGNWVAELALATRFAPKKGPNGTLEQFKLTLTPAHLREVLRDGYRLRTTYTAGRLAGDLRIVLQDRDTGELGSVTVPLGNR
jgi:VWFA-related protein